MGTQASGTYTAVKSSLNVLRPFIESDVKSFNARSRIAFIYKLYYFFFFCYKGVHSILIIKSTTTAAMSLLFRIYCKL